MHALQTEAAARVQHGLLKLRMQRLQIALQLCKVQIGVEVAGLLHALSGLTQRREDRLDGGHLLDGLSHTLPNAETLR